MATTESKESQESKAAGAQARRRQGRVLISMLPFLWADSRVRLLVFIAMLGLVGSRLVSVVVPLLFARSVDAFGVNNPGHETVTALVALPLGLILAYGTARVMQVVLQELRDWTFAPVGQQAMREIALTCFRHMHNLSLRFHLERRTGALSRVIERGTKAIDFLLTFALFNIVPTLIEVLLVCGILWAFFSFWFAFVTFATITAYILFSLRATEWRLKFRRVMNEYDADANARSVDALLNYETVKYFNNEEYEAKRFEAKMKGYEGASVRSIQSLSVVNIGQSLIISVGLVILMVMAGLRVTEGTMTIGEFVLVNAYLLQLYAPLNFLGFVYREIRRCLTDMDDMFSLLEQNVEVKNVATPRPFQLDKPATIRFENVDFSYNPDRQILSNFNLEIPAGHRVAVVGPSGSGKSTLMRLLFRFYDVQGGRITIDGVDIREIDQLALRSSIGIVPQDTVLFNDSIGYNVHYGRPAASFAEVEQAAEAAQIGSFISSLPEGYETQVGERGLKLSGGEKQRVAIARMILKNPPILGFDEATSALDTATEREIQRALDDLSVNKTTLVIAHRLSTVVHSEKIVVLEGGSEVESGSHRELLSHNGLYATMWQRQLESVTEPAVSDGAASDPAVSDGAASDTAKA